jgi:hypothetical protein
MPSWEIHEKWCASFGLPEEVCKKVNHAIDRGFKHDAHLRSERLQKIL